MNIRGTRARFFISVTANALRAGISYATGLLVARALSPSGYGDLTFLLGSFVAIRSLLDLGSASAFYTFLSQRTRGRRFYLLYFAWLASQFVITLVLVTLVIPSGMFERIWLGHTRDTVLLAFVAAFMQQQVWQTVGQIGEAARNTLRVQLLNIGVAVSYLTIVWLLFLYGGMSVTLILLVLIGQYALATVLSYRFLKEPQTKPLGGEDSYKQTLGAYWAYCRPMAWMSVAGFVYLFADKWMLQRFGGASQQGYFQVASQFAQISLLATTSILNVFWKEIAEASARSDHDRVARLYRKVNRGLVILSASIAGLLQPWSEQIVAILLGPTYVNAWPALAIMLLYPIHQSMGQIGGTMLLARGHTRIHAIVSTAILPVYALCSYLAMAPTTGVLVPGLGLGAVGMAGNMVLLNILAVNIQAWVIARIGGWDFDWLYQMIGIPLMLGLGYLAKTMVGLLWKLDSAGTSDVIGAIVFVCFVYAVSVAAIIWTLPWLIGMEREEIRRSVGKLRGLN